MKKALQIVGNLDNSDGIGYTVRRKNAVSSIGAKAVFRSLIFIHQMKTQKGVLCMKLLQYASLITVAACCLPMLAACNTKERQEARDLTESVAVETTGAIPEELAAAYDAFYEKREAVIESDAAYSLRSDNLLDVAPEERSAAQAVSVQYFSDCAALACSDSEYRLIAQDSVGAILQLPIGIRQGAEFLEKAQEQYQLASEAIAAQSCALTAENVAALQETYGYLIAPALQELGALDLIRIPDGALCTDPEQLADFAAYFA